MGRVMSSWCRNDCELLGAITLKALLVAGAGWLCIESMAARAALAQSSTPTAQAVPAINLGGRGWSGAQSGRAAPDGGKNQLEFEFRGGLASDYIYRGVTLSDRKPAVGAAIEATYGLLYAGVAVASVKLPTQPAAEISMSGGIRPTLGMIDFDLGVTHFRYPGENPAAESKGIDYWEAAIRGRNKARRVGPDRRWICILAERLQHRRMEPLRGWRDRLRRAEPNSAGRYRRVVHRSDRILLVWPPVARSWRLSAPRIPQLAGRNDDHPQDDQPRPALSRHQSLEGKLFRLHGRSQRTTGRPPRSHHQSRWPDLTMVWRNVRREALVRVELASRSWLQGVELPIRRGPLRAIRDRAEPASGPGYVCYARKNRQKLRTGAKAILKVNPTQGDCLG